MSESILLPKVLIVDDHPTFCLGVSALIRKLGFVEVCGQAHTAADAMDIFRHAKPEIVVMDIGLPDGNGIEITEIMHQEKPDTAILILSMQEDALYAIKAIKAGAVGYLRKDDGLAELAEALHKITGRKLHVSSSFKHHFILNSLKKKTDTSKPFLSVLSQRQRDVFDCLGKGMSRGEVATELGLSIKTIETHRTQIKKKLGLTSTAEAIRLAKDWHAVESDKNSESTDASLAQYPNIKSMVGQDQV